MKTNMHPNSLDTYTDLIESGKVTKGQMRALRALRIYGNLTREQIASRAIMKESSVCGRIRELLDADIVLEVGTTKTSTGNPAAIIALAPQYQPQRES